MFKNKVFTKYTLRGLVFGFKFCQNVERVTKKLGLATTPDEQEIKIWVQRAIHLFLNGILLPLKNVKV
jgi:hypothetical protein